MYRKLQQMKENGKQYVNNIIATNQHIKEPTACKENRKN